MGVIAPVTVTACHRNCEGRAVISPAKAAAGRANWSQGRQTAEDEVIPDLLRERSSNRGYKFIKKVRDVICIPQNRRTVIRVKMRFSFLEFLFFAEINYRFSEPFCVSGFPICSRVIMREID